MGSFLQHLIRALAPASGLARLAELRAERDYWKQMLEKAEECLASANSIKNVIAADRDTLAAANAALEAKVAGLRSAFRVNMLRYGPPGTSHEEINAAIDAALAEHGGTQK